MRRANPTAQIRHREPAPGRDGGEACPGDPRPRGEEAPPCAASAGYRALALGLALVLTLAFWNSPGTIDVATWKKWAGLVGEHGPILGYQAIGADYPPLGSLLIWLATALGAALGLEMITALKGLLLIATMVASLQILRLGDPTRAAWFHAVAVLSGLGLVYLDIFYAPPLLVALGALETRRLRLAAVAFTMASLIKWQPLILAPLFAVRWWALRPPCPRQALRDLVPAAALAAGVVALYGWEPVLASLGRAMSHNTLSANALNAPWLATWGWRWWIDKLSHGRCAYMVIPAPWVGWVFKLAMLVLYAAAVRKAWRVAHHHRPWLEATLAAYLCYLMYNTGVHENHWFIAALLAACCAARNARARLPATLITAFTLVNLVIFYGMDGTGLHFNRVWFNLLDATVPLAALAVVGHALFWWDTVRARPTPLAPHDASP